MQLNIGVIRGDGIGPEIVTEAIKVLNKVGEVYGHSYTYNELLMGGASIDVHGVPLTDETIIEAKTCDAVAASTGDNLISVSIKTSCISGRRNASLVSRGSPVYRKVRLIRFRLCRKLIHSAASPLSHAIRFAGFARGPQNCAGQHSASNKTP